MFPISRDPPEGGTQAGSSTSSQLIGALVFPISRDPPEGGTFTKEFIQNKPQGRFQFLGIPPKGEPEVTHDGWPNPECFQFLGIPPKGEQGGIYGLRKTNNKEVSNF